MVVSESTLYLELFNIFEQSTAAHAHTTAAGACYIAIASVAMICSGQCWLHLHAAYSIAVHDSVGYYYKCSVFLPDTAPCFLMLQMERLMLSDTALCLQCATHHIGWTRCRRQEKKFLRSFELCGSLEVGTSIAICVITGPYLQFCFLVKLQFKSKGHVMQFFEIEGLALNFNIWVMLHFINSFKFKY